MVMLPIQQYYETRKKRIITAFGIVAGGLWILLIGYLSIGVGQEKKIVGTSHVAVRVASPTLTQSAPTLTNLPRYGSHKSLTYCAPADYSHTYAQATGSSSMHIHTTSSATMKSIGGNGNTSSGGFGGYSSKGNRGVGNSAVIHMGAIYIPKTSNAVTEVGAKRANEVATTTASEPPTKGPLPRTVSGDPRDPFLDPVGDVAWGWMTLLASAYIILRAMRMRKRAMES